MTIATWTPEARAGFARDEVSVRHSLHTRAMFDDARLAELLDRYPRERLGVFTMGEDAADWGTWRRGEASDLSGTELLAEVKAGRLWLNLRAVNVNDQAYAELSREIFAEVEAMTGRRTFKQDVGLLISSPKAQVFYHLDIPLVMLWQLRGEKRVRVYPVAEPFVDEAQIERIVLGDSAEQFAFDLAWDKDATVFDLKPGMMVSWPQNAPHRVENGDMLNLSLSIEFMTAEALMRANVLYANGLMRRMTGRAPKSAAVSGAGALAKFAVARAHKLAMKAPRGKVLPESFRLKKAG